MRNLIITLVALFFVTSCGVSDEKPVVIQTQTGNTSETDTSQVQEEFADVSLCAVDLRFILKNGEGSEVQFKNGNDATVIVDIFNSTTGGKVATNCLWPNGEDNETATFKKGETMEVVVYLGDGQIIQWTCLEFIGDISDAFNECDSLEAVVN